MARATRRRVSFVGENRHFVERHFVVSARSLAPPNGDSMMRRSLLFSGPALLFPIPRPAPQPPAPAAAAEPPAAPPTPATAPSDDLGDEEEIVITGGRPRGSV